jgi:hypothetical protein
MPVPPNTFRHVRHDDFGWTLEDLREITRLQKNLLCGGSTFGVMSIDDLLYMLR